MAISTVWSRCAATLDETLRLYPATHRIGRTVKTPVVVGGHLLPVGADVVIPQWAVHRSARWYQEPEAFVPGRWTPAFRKSLPRFAYFPFSGGPRTCVGGQLAWSECAVILGFLAQRFRFSLCDSAPLLPREGLTLLPAAGGLRVRIESRIGTSNGWDSTINQATGGDSANSKATPPERIHEQCPWDPAQ